MRFVIALVGILALPATCLAQQQIDMVRPNEIAFQCGSAFAIAGQAYSDAGKTNESARFRGKAQKPLLWPRQSSHGEVSQSLKHRRICRNMSIRWSPWNGPWTIVCSPTILETARGAFQTDHSGPKRIRAPQRTARF